MSTTHSPADEKNRSAVTLAVLIIAALATAIGVFVSQGSKPATARPREKVKAQPTRPGVARIPVRSRPELVRGSKNRDRQNPRQEYAMTLNRRLRAKGRTCVIRATGELGRILEIRWTKDKQDKEHMEKLKLAQGFFAQLRDLTFSSLIMKVDDKVVWSKSL